MQSPPRFPSDFTSPPGTIPTSEPPRFPSDFTSPPGTIITSEPPRFPAGFTQPPGTIPMGEPPRFPSGFTNPPGTSPMSEPTGLPSGFSNPPETIHMGEPPRFPPGFTNPPGTTPTSDPPRLGTNVTSEPPRLLTGFTMSPGTIPMSEPPRIPSGFTGPPEPTSTSEPPRLPSGFTIPPGTIPTSEPPRLPSGFTSPQGTIPTNEPPRFPSNFTILPGPTPTSEPKRLPFGFTHPPGTIPTSEPPGTIPTSDPPGLTSGFTSPPGTIPMVESPRHPPGFTNLPGTVPSNEPPRLPSGFISPPGAVPTRIPTSEPPPGWPAIGPPGTIATSEPPPGWPTNEDSELGSTPGASGRTTMQSPPRLPSGFTSPPGTMPMSEPPPGWPPNEESEVISTLDVGSGGNTMQSPPRFPSGFTNPPGTIAAGEPPRLPSGFTNPPGTVSTGEPPRLSSGFTNPPGTIPTGEPPRLPSGFTSPPGTIPMSEPPPGWPANEDSGNNQLMQGPPPEKQLPSLLSLKVDPPKQVEPPTNTEVILPQALEQVLALKNQRAMELGTEEDTGIVEREKPKEQEPRETIWEKDENVVLEQIVDAEVEEEPRYVKSKDGKEKVSKNKKKKKRKKNKKHRVNDEIEQEKEKVVENGTTHEKEGGSEPSSNLKDDIQIEYVQERIGLHELAPQYRQFYTIFEQFKISDERSNIPPPTLANITSLSTQPKMFTDDDQNDDNEEFEDKKPEDKGKMSKRKLKKLTRLSVAELKQLVHRPDVVEMHDVTARDPKLLVQLKAHRNTVQVPRHWCFKRKYLQGKRGIEKPPFNLPDFIKRTGIMEMRASLQEKDESKTLKAKMRERARPKLGKIDIDYQKLHDAFFKWQTKPKMTIHGDLYYEGKEFETRLKEKKPGDLSEELRTALGMPVGPNANKVPPPWLIAMQRYGPPPSYPNLKIPGLNAPIPEACSFGYHAGGWGKPPVDENGKPLYGDVFGTNQSHIDDIGEDPSVDRSLWGELESESEEESEEEEEEEEETETQPPDESGLVTPAEGLVTPSGITSIPAGMETPEAIELRKKKIENEMEGTETPVLYHIIPEKRNDRIGSAMMASTHVYDLASLGASQNPIPIRRPTEREGMVELALDPSELDMDSDAMAVRYEQQIRENQSQLQKEDLSDMLAEHVAKQKSKRKRQQQESKTTKKYKEFKF